MNNNERAEMLRLMAEELNAFYSEDFDHEVKPGEIMTGYGKIKNLILVLYYKVRLVLPYYHQR